ncbi:MAG: HpcH/HpaI aldolase family protein [Spirochaetota bacterium]
MEITHTNAVKKLLKEKKKVSGAWAQAASNITSQILAETGFDVLMLDMEHAPGDILTLISQIQSMQGYPAVPFVRAPWNDFVQIKRILDAGTYGVLVPYVNTKAEAEDAVKAMKYPTKGIRGVAGSPRAAHFANNSIEYFKSANDEIVLMTAVETGTAVENLDEILQVPEIDGIFIGPADLATDMGYMADASQPEVQEAIRTIEKKVNASDKFLSTVAKDWDDAQKKYERGYNLLLMMSDTTTLSKVARALVGDFSKNFPQR